jgi:hypothetical protein
MKDKEPKLEEIEASHTSTPRDRNGHKLKKGKKKNINPLGVEI